MAVFAKAAEPGRVKTRLLPVLRAREAADLHRALLLDTLDVVERTRAEIVVAFTPAGGRRSLERLLGRHSRLLAQGPGDLGVRLVSVTGRLIAERGRPVVAIGSDCPALTPETLRKAYASLGRADVVLGPAVDGGYYLVGLVAPRPEIFTGIPWSSGRVLETTVRRIDEARLKYALLEEARDLDTPADLFQWFADARGTEARRHYPRTWQFLHAIFPPRRFSALEAAVLGIAEH